MDVLFLYIVVESYSDIHLGSVQFYLFYPPQFEIAMIFFIIIAYVLSDHTRKIFLIGLLFFDPKSASFSEWAFTSHQTKLRSLDALFTSTDFSINKDFPFCNVGLS